MNIWYLIVLSHWRKKHILGLIIILIAIACLTPLFNSIALGQGDIVNSSFQHLFVELVGLLFLVYFWSTLLKWFSDNKTLQLLWSKKKKPFSFLAQSWLGLYSVYAAFILVTTLGASLYYADLSISMSFLNLLISGAITLSLVMLFSCLTNAYAAMISSLVMYTISYSLNFIIFSTPYNFEGHLSFKILKIVQLLFPRFDILYSTLTHLNTWIWASLGNILYFLCVSFILVRVFLSRYSKK